MKKIFSIMFAVAALTMVGCCGGNKKAAAEAEAPAAVECCEEKCDSTACAEECCAEKECCAEECADCEKKECCEKAE